ncbi:MAG: transketolase [Bauldia sp.]|nr:transketolase [Bauldia sp.]
MDAVQANNSGHPGTAMGMADIAEVLWNDFLSHNPADPDWPNRDRFVQSNGHGSMLIYSLLHLAGYDLSLDDLRRHRQFGSRTPGHPERGMTPGVETTTGPLGQGFATAVGMALAERRLAEEFNRDGFPVVDHFTYVFAGDGCLMEGISQEAASLAGTLGLSKLITVYDDNNISIDGEVGDWFADDTAARFRSLNWHVIADVDGHDPAAVHAAYQAARASDRPTLICCKTTIGFGSPNKQGKEESHGAPLGVEEVALTRKALGWPHAPFEIPEDVAAGWDGRGKGKAAQAEWDRMFAAYRTSHPELAAEFSRRMKGERPPGLDALVKQEAAAIIEKPAVDQPLRKASNRVAGLMVEAAPELVGGSADLSESTLAWTQGSRSIRPGDFSGNFVHYGVREFAMSAMMNGMAAHGGVVPYGSTYLVFSDYSRNAVRLASLMKLRSIFIYTHDSIGVGEDGPTHQPSEQLVALRAIPDFSVWRPGSELEALIAWDESLLRDGPSAMVLARQGSKGVDHQPGDDEKIRKGGYVLSDPATGAAPDVVLAGTGSELVLVRQAAARLAAEGVAVRVVSVPNANIFARQPEEYRSSILPRHLPTVVVEAASSLYWYQFLGGRRRIIGVDRFGESAPGAEVFSHFGFTVDAIAEAALALLADKGDVFAVTA